MRLVWLNMALEDRLRIMNIIAESNPGAAITLDTEFRDKARQAAQQPNLYKQGRYPGTREVVVRPNYVMVYRCAGEKLEIIRILHAWQQWP